VNQISAFQSDGEAVETILAGIASEAETLYDQLGKDIDKAGEKALDTKRTKVLEFEDRLKATEKLLGRSCDAMLKMMKEAKERIAKAEESVQAGVSLALLSGGDDDEDA